MFCSVCGASLTGDSPRFCSNCGAEQRAQQESSSGAATEPSPGIVAAQSPSAPDASWPVGATPNTGSFLEVGRVEVGMMTFLSTITLGIYFLVWLYKSMRVYRTLSGRAGANLEQYFWGTVIAFGSAIILSLITGVLGVLALIAGIVIEALLINEVIKDRDAAAPANIQPLLPSAGLLVTLLVVGNVVSLTICGLIIGIPIAVWFYYQFFTGHNLLIEGLERGQRG